MAATVTVFLADESVIIREGVAAMIRRENDLEIVGTAEDYDGLVGGASDATPNVVVSDIRMPPSFQTQGIDGCKEIHRRRCGLGLNLRTHRITMDRSPVADNVESETLDRPLERQTLDARGHPDEVVTDITQISATVVKDSLLLMSLTKRK